MWFHSYLESAAILPARTFLSHFLALTLAAYPALLVVRFPFPSPSSPLAKQGGVQPDEVVVTTLASLNFVQLTLRAAQCGVGEAVDKTRDVKGELVVAKGGGRAVWKGLLQRYEREVQWLREPDAKEVSSSAGVVRERAKLTRKWWSQSTTELGVQSVDSSRRMSCQPNADVSSDSQVLWNRPTARARQPAHGQSVGNSRWSLHG